MNIKQLREAIRENFGPAEVRQHKNFITVTLRDSDFGDVVACEAAASFFLREEAIDDLYDAVGKSANRFYLYNAIDEDNADEDVGGFGREVGISEEDLNKLKAIVEATTEAAHEESVFVNLLTKRLDTDVAVFVQANLPVANKALSGASVKNYAKLEAVLVLSYLTGRFADVRCAEHDFLEDYILAYAENNGIECEMVK